jgi:hypothetical protein
MRRGRCNKPEVSFRFYTGVQGVPGLPHKSANMAYAGLIGGFIRLYAFPGKRRDRSSWLQKRSGTMPLGNVCYLAHSTNATKKARQLITI